MHTSESRTALCVLFHMPSDLKVSRSLKNQFRMHGVGVKTRRPRLNHVSLH